MVSAFKFGGNRSFWLHTVNFVVQRWCAGHPCRIPVLHCARYRAITACFYVKYKRMEKRAYLMAFPPFLIHILRSYYTATEVIQIGLHLTVAEGVQSVVQ